MKTIWTRGSMLLAALALAAACAEDTDGEGGSTGGDPQLPPQGAEAMKVWLAEGHFEGWKCEAVHDARSPSPHGRNRVCSNDLASAHTEGEYPVGAASVKELFDASGNILGHAVSVHVVAGTTGASWYWYEVLGGSVAADGLGDAGVPLQVCVGCHADAGGDAMHSGHDFVYTQVK